MRGRKRHPIRGFFGGLFLGLGGALLLVLYGEVAFGTLTPYFVVLGGVVLGLVWAYVAPARGRAEPTAVPAPAPAPPPVPETEAATEGTPPPATDPDATPGAPAPTDDVP